MIFKKDISSLHVPHNKNTAGCEPVKIQTPKEVILPMNMHSGSVAEPIVNVGDHVYVGQLIAREGERFFPRSRNRIRYCCRDTQPSHRSRPRRCCDPH